MSLSILTLGQIPHPQYKPATLIGTYTSRFGGGSEADVLEYSNDDHDDIFGDHVYLILLNSERGLPAHHATIPFASCTSFAMAQTTVLQLAELPAEATGYTIYRLPKLNMPPEAFKRISMHDRMMENPEIRKMYEARQKRIRRDHKRK